MILSNKFHVLENLYFFVFMVFATKSIQNVHYLKLLVILCTECRMHTLLISSPWLCHYCTMHIVGKPIHTQQKWNFLGFDILAISCLFQQ